MKETKRKYFKFYRSYYDVFNELNDQDKLAFANALFDKQFLDVEPVKLTGILKIVWVSLWNSIDQQVKGYKHKSKDPMQGGAQGGKQGATLTPEPQEKEKEKEKVEYTIPAFEVFLSYAQANDNKISPLALKHKYEAWVVNGWKDGKDNAIKNWKVKLLHTLQYIDKVKEETTWQQTGLLGNQ